MTKDVMRITGKNRRQSQTIISSIKKELNEKRQQPVTIGEFRQHHYIDRQELLRPIRSAIPRQPYPIFLRRPQGVYPPVDSMQSA